MEWESSVTCEFSSTAHARHAKETLIRGTSEDRASDSRKDVVLSSDSFEMLLRSMDGILLKVCLKGKRLILTLSSPEEPEWFHEKICSSLGRLGAERIKANVSWESGTSAYVFSEGKFSVVNFHDSEDSPHSVIENQLNHSYGVGEEGWSFEVARASDFLRSIKRDAVGDINLDQVYAAFEKIALKGEYLYQGEDPVSKIWTSISITRDTLFVNRVVALKAPGYPARSDVGVFDITLDDVTSYMDQAGFHARKEHLEKSLDPEIYRWWWRYKEFDCCVSWRPGELDQEFGLSRFLSYDATLTEGKAEDIRTREEKVADILREIKEESARRARISDAD
ncbi:hypothetical protein [Isoalcanivorax indicus]|uniref:hypothetical protein n=1 Tax=Isoalcanivorax indicus TaxID=2202653 RepID=UPI000DBA22BF|nr:hypothetical protein [Isoalcanivorax indicus]